LSFLDLFLGVNLNLLELFGDNFDDFLVAFFEFFSNFLSTNVFGDFVARFGDGFLDFFLLLFDNFLLEMFVDFGDFHNMDLGLSFLHFLDNFLGLFDNFGCTIFSSFLADFLDEFSGFLFDFSFVDFQARFVADFDIT